MHGNTAPAIAEYIPGQWLTEIVALSDWALTVLKESELLVRL
jgi:hypothetical protein